jgi:4-hydroxy-tetrahydrodipicolinate synthase
MALAIRGCGTAIVSPFDERGKLDFGALERIVEWQIQQRIDFLVTCTPVGESPALSGDERRAVTAHVVKTADRRVPVLAGAGGNHTAKSIFWARDAEKAGADAILSALPYYNHPTLDGLAKHYGAIADATRVPIFLYNLPERTGTDLPVEMLLRLAEIPRIAGLVDASGDFGRLAAATARVADGFVLLAGDDRTALSALALGMNGLVSVAANEVPAEMRAMVDAALADRWEEARGIFRKYLPLFEANALESIPGPVKAALSLMGRSTETLRLPLAPVREETRRRIEKVLRALKLLPKSR